jgi:hypothetical protein
MSNTTSHAYSHLIGTTLGVLLGTTTNGQNLIVSGTVVMPVDGQDDNYVRVILENGIETYVRYMDTYRSDFVTGVSNGDISGDPVWDLDY